MCSIHIDESLIHVSIAAWLSRLYVPFSGELNSLLDRLDNRYSTHDSRSNALEWVCGNRNDAIAPRRFKDYPQHLPRYNVG
jgi:hypothetical protein